LPSFEPSGILAEFSNQYKGVVLKFTEPLDAALPTDHWKIYPFKGEEALGKSNHHLLLDLMNFIDAISIFKKKTCYLFGRDPKICDILLDNPSCSS
jgi:smad nuclear-interacting protein 1